jgi:anti-sigma B factor antagonist
MEIEEAAFGRTIVVTPRGRLDSASAKAFEESLMRVAAAEKPAVVVDFTDLDYISSAGLRVLLMAAKRTKAAHGALVLCGLKPHVREVFDVSGFSTLFTIETDRATALETAA